MAFSLGKNPPFDYYPHDRSSSPDPHHFLDTNSWRASTSRSRAADSRFTRRFSCSRYLSIRASVTSIPRTSCASGNDKRSARLSRGGNTHLRMFSARSSSRQDADDLIFAASFSQADKGACITGKPRPIITKHYEPEAL